MKNLIGLNIWVLIVNIVVVLKHTSKILYVMFGIGNLEM